MSYKRKRTSKKSLTSVKRRLFAPRRYLSSNFVSYGRLSRSMFLDIPVFNGVGAGYGLSYNSSGVQLNGITYAWPGATDIANAYDAYRIKSVNLVFSYNQNSSNVNQNVNDLPYLFLVNDYDDASLFTTNDILARDGATMKLLGGNPAGSDIRWSVVPKLAVAAYATALATGYMEPKAMQWVSTGGPAGFNDPVHYGTKFYVDATKQTSVSGQQGNLRIFAKCLFETKHAQ